MTNDERFEISAFNACGRDISNRKLDEKTRLLRLLIVEKQPCVSLCAQCLLKQYHKDWGPR